MTLNSGRYNVHVWLFSHLIDQLIDLLLKEMISRQMRNFSNLFEFQLICLSSDHTVYSNKVDFNFILLNSPAGCLSRARSWTPQWACAAGTRWGTRAHRWALRACTPCWRCGRPPHTARRLGSARTPPAPCSASGTSPAWCSGGRGANRSRSEPSRYRRSS